MAILTIIVHKRKMNFDTCNSKILKSQNDNFLDKYPYMIYNNNYIYCTFYLDQVDFPTMRIFTRIRLVSWYPCYHIGLYRDVWSAAIASSRKSLTTLSVVMRNTSQCKSRSLRVNSGMGNVQCNVHCDAVHVITTKWVFGLTPDCNGVFAIKAYGNVCRSSRFYFLEAYFMSVFLFTGLMMETRTHMDFTSFAR